MHAQTIFALAVAGLLALASQLYSQAPGTPKTPLEQLQVIKLKNKELIDRQSATLEKLDVLQKEAEQVKFLAKRT
jgi:hypothetical protein